MAIAKQPDKFPVSGALMTNVMAKPPRLRIAFSISGVSPYQFIWIDDSKLQFNNSPQSHPRITKIFRLLSQGCGSGLPCRGHFFDSSPIRRRSNHSRAGSHSIKPANQPTQSIAQQTNGQTRTETAKRSWEGLKFVYVKLQSRTYPSRESREYF